MARRGCTCGVCEAANQPAVCAACVNLRLAEKYKLLRRLVQERDALRKRLETELKAKRQADIQQHWRIEHAERKTKLLVCLHKNEKSLLQNRQKHERRKLEYESRKRLLDATSAQLHKRQKELLEQIYPEQIQTLVVKLTIHLTDVNQKRRHLFRHLTKVFPLCYSQGDSEKSQGVKERQFLRICGACLPVRDDPHSVSVEDLSASLGYMVQLVYQAARYLSAPILHNAAFAASSSRIWQRTSYWDVHPSSRSEEYPLFLPRKGERLKPSAESSLKSDRHGSGSGSGFFSLEKPSFLLRSKMSISDSGQNEHDRDVKQGLKLLKRSVSCICVYGYTILGLPVPSNMSTFETFMELLSVLSSRENKTRPNRPVFSRTDGSVLQGSFSATIQDSEALRNQGKSRMDMSDFFCVGADFKNIGSRTGEYAADEWDVVERPVLPTPSETEDVEHWSRAMFTDATNDSAANRHKVSRAT